MSWRDLLQTNDETIVLPWVGGRSLQTFTRTWRITGKLPAEHGWFTFTLDNRKARCAGPAEFPDDDAFKNSVSGYLVGDRLMADDVRVPTDPKALVEVSEQVHLIERGLDRFVRVQAARVFGGGPLIYPMQDFPRGPEDAVQTAFQDKVKTLDKIPAVVPALDAAFRFEVYQRKQVEKRRLEEEKRRQEEAEALQAEERRQEIIERLGDGAGRRAMALVDFAEAARAALAVGAAEYLEHRESYNKGEMVVRFRTINRRFECTCDAKTLAILDSGICLIDHATGRKDDQLLTLESLPTVIRQADRERKLVVFRRVDGEINDRGHDGGDDDYDDYDY